MNYFQEITLLPNADVSLGFLWQKIYQQVHIALVEQKVDEQHSAIALGFPMYGYQDFSLGNKLRAFACEYEQLEQLNLVSFLKRFEDYCHLRSIQPVPKENTVSVAFVRKRVKGRARIEKDLFSKAQRWSVKSGKSLESCINDLEKAKPRSSSKLPFIWVESQQTKASNPENSSRFPLFIERRESDTHVTGLFNCYGLSVLGSDHVATVPHF